MKKMKTHTGIPEPYKCDTCGKEAEGIWPHDFSGGHCSLKQQRGGHWLIDRDAPLLTCCTPCLLARPDPLENKLHDKIYSKVANAVNDPRGRRADFCDVRVSIDARLRARIYYKGNHYKDLPAAEVKQILKM